MKDFEKKGFEEAELKVVAFGKDVVATSGCDEDCGSDSCSGDTCDA